MKPGSKRVARYSQPQRDLSSSGMRDISPAIPKPPKVREVRQPTRRVHKQQEPNWLIIILTVIGAAIALLIGASGGFDGGSSGGGSHASHSHR